MQQYFGQFSGNKAILPHLLAQNDAYSGFVFGCEEGEPSADSVSSPASRAPLVTSFSPRTGDETTTGLSLLLGDRILTSGAGHAD